MHTVYSTLPHRRFRCLSLPVNIINICLIFAFNDSYGHRLASDVFSIYSGKELLWVDSRSVIGASLILGGSLSEQVEEEDPGVEPAEPGSSGKNGRRREGGSCVVVVVVR